MTTPNRHPKGITRPEFLMGRVDTSLAGLSNPDRLALYVAKKLHRNPTGTHRQIDTRPLWFRHLSILSAAIGGGAFLAVVFAAVYFVGDLI